MKKKSTINLLGDGKLVFSALVPTFIETTNELVLVVSRKDTLMGIDKCILKNLNGMEYSVSFGKTQFDSLDEFLRYMEEKVIPTGIISYDSNLFVEMIKNGNGGIWFSACREGLIETYLPLLEQYITKPTHVLIFDNDESIAKKAQEVCNNSNIYFHKCIVHSVCSDMEYDYTSHVINLNNGKECLLIFPPEMQYIKSEFENNIWGGRSQLVFTDSDDMFQFFSKWKCIGINALHTLASIKAYSIGIQNGLSLKEISGKDFSTLISETELLEYVMKIHSILYDKYLASYAGCVNASKDLFEKITQDFFRGLYTRHENVGRGLSVSHSSFGSKLERHIPLLRDSGDQETIDMLDMFMEKLHS